MTPAQKLQHQYASDLRDIASIHSKLRLFENRFNVPNAIYKNLGEIELQIRRTFATARIRILEKKGLL